MRYGMNATTLSILILTLAACGDEASNAGGTPAAPAPEAAYKVSAPAGLPPVAAATADFNLDGQTDLAVLTGAGTGMGQVAVYYGPISHSGAPVADETYQVPATSSDLLAADLDGDQIPDLAVALAGDAAFPGRVHLLYRTLYTGLKREGEILTGYSARTLRAADVDADGRTDLVVGGGTATFVVRALGAGRFSSPISLPALAPFDAGDFDSNGTMEVVGVPILTPGRLEFYRWSQGTFVLAASVAAPGAVCTLAPAAMDEDWALDLVVGCSSGIFVLRGRGEFTFDVTFASGSAGAEILATGDLDGDSVADIGSVGGPAGGVMENYSGTGSGNWYWVAGRAVGTARDLDAADLDGDGAADLVVCAGAAEIHFLKR